MARKSRSKQRGKGVGTRSGTGGGSSNRGGNSRGSGTGGGASGSSGGGQKGGKGKTSSGKGKTTNTGPRGRSGAGTGGGQKSGKGLTRRQQAAQDRKKALAAQSYKGNQAFGSGNLPSNYKATEAKAFKEAAEFKQKQAARNAQLGINLKNFDAKSYLARYKDLSDAFGTDEAAARQHYKTYGFNENRDISQFTAPSPKTTVPSGSFGISEEGKAQAEANRDSYARNNDPVGYIARNVNPLSIAGAVAQDAASLNQRYNQDITGRQYSEEGKTALSEGPRESTLKGDVRDAINSVTISSNIKNAQPSGNESLRDARLNAFANSNSQDVANIAQKALGIAENSQIVNTLGQAYGLPSNFQSQIQDSREGFQKNYLDKIKIGDPVSTRAALSDFAANVGRDPDVGLIGRGIYQASEGTGNVGDRIVGAFQDGTGVNAQGMSIAASPSIQGLNRDEMGIMGSLYNYFGSNMARDVAMENYTGDIHNLPQGEGFDALSLTQFAQNMASNATDPTSVTSVTGGKLADTLGIGKGGPTPGSLIKGVTGLNLGGGNKAPTTGTGSSLTIEGGVDTDTDTGTGGDLTIGGGDDDNTGTTPKPPATLVPSTTTTPGSGSSGGSSGTPDSGDVSGYTPGTDSPGSGSSIGGGGSFTQTLKGLRFNDPAYRARLRNRRRGLRGFRGTFNRAPLRNRMKIKS